MSSLGRPRSRPGSLILYFAMPTIYILQIETSTTVCSVAISADGVTKAFLEIKEENVHASKLTLLIEELMEQAGLKYADLHAVAVTKGPGSYTGLRIGVSTAKGLCYALDIPLIAIDSLRALALGFAGTDQRFLRREEAVIKENSAVAKEMLLCPMIDARRMEVYCAVYSADLEEISPTEAKIMDEDSFLTLDKHQQIVLFGSGADKLQELYAKHHQVSIVFGFQASAQAMSSFAYQAFSIQAFEDLAYFEPFYLKNFIPTTPKRK